MAVVKNAQGLSGAQVIILQELAKHPNGLETQLLAQATKVPVSSATIGPAFTNLLKDYPESLRGRDLAYCEKMEGEKVKWYLTAEGEQIARTFKGRKIGPTKKVPNKVLDPAVMKFKTTRAYGLEQYKEDDLTALRSALPKEYQDVDVAQLGDLHNQILARRKQGAFSDPEEKRRKQLQKLYREFGPNGTVIEGFLYEDQAAQLLSMLGGDAGADDE